MNASCESTSCAEMPDDRRARGPRSRRRGRGRSRTVSCRRACCRRGRRAARRARRGDRRAGRGRRCPAARSPAPARRPAGSWPSRSPPLRLDRPRLRIARRSISSASTGARRACVRRLGDALELACHALPATSRVWRRSAACVARGRLRQQRAPPTSPRRRRRLGDPSAGHRLGCAPARLAGVRAGPAAQRRPANCSTGITGANVAHLRRLTVALPGHRRLLARSTCTACWSRGARTT